MAIAEQPISMNRFVLIGNGFDLAHGLKTSYADFVDLKQIFKRL